MPNSRYVSLVFGAAVLICCFRTALSQDELPPPAGPDTPGYVSGELIYPVDDPRTPRPMPQCHASTIVQTSTGLLAAWFGGTREGHNDVGIWLANHTADGWSTPRQIVDGSNGESRDDPCWNPVLFQPTAFDSKTPPPLYLFYKVGPSPAAWWGMLVTSADEGATWSEPRKLGTNAALPDGNRNLLGPVRNKPLQLADGMLVCPSSTENDGWRVHFELTRDLGKTWEVVGPLPCETPLNAIQPTLLTHPDGTLQCLCRTQENVIAESRSHDGGQTWSPLAATSFPNPNSGIDAVTLADGRHLLVYNHTQTKGDFPSGRNMLNVAISADGKLWRTVMTLERDRGEFSYPAVIQTADGRVHVTYTWNRVGIKHVELDPARLESASK